MRLLVCCAISVHCRNVVQLLDTGRLDYVKDEGAAPVNERWCSVEPLGRDSGKCGPDYAHCYVRNVCACVRGKLENGGLFSTTNFNLDQCPDLVVQHGYYGLESGTTHTQPASRAQWCVIFGLIARPSVFLVSMPVLFSSSSDYHHRVVVIVIIIIIIIIDGGIRVADDLRCVGMCAHQWYIDDE